ncbi:Nbs-lrr resistance protein [Rhynchospora pubera]|uniref:Nbs-lrr resistance protein n=1 Tax=Rhynchospora pubera TaxID=906938 RepID=A0AAV8HM30_9POAL|nr:Nbs-lrr resistance protein [Rhynchospora pubera]
MAIIAEGLLGGVSGIVRDGLLGGVSDIVRDKLIPEFKSLWGTDEEVERLKDQKDRIWEFICDVYKKQVVDKWQMQWVIDLIHLAYQIETALETYHDGCAERGPEEPPLGIIGRIKCGLKKTTQIRFLSDFQKEITAIKERICELEEYRQRYGIITVGEDWDDVGGRQNKRIKWDPVHTLRPIGNPDIIGFATDINNILRWLLDENIARLAVVSVVGIGGAGKSTITRKVCNSNDVKESFDKVIFIEITRNYVSRNILREIAKMLEINSTDEGERELSYLIWERLENTRYLIVLDDVWTEDLWDELSKILPDKEKRSRVMITTRFENVAKRADTTYPPYKLPLLNADESLNLFLRKAVPKNHQYPDPSSNLYNLAKQFAAKCQGLPLALELLGSLVSIKPYTFHAWKDLLRTMTFHADVHKCIDVVATSYEYLPLNEKLCFLYFAAFPQSITIDAEQLFRIWSGDGLIRIRSNEKRAVEEIAESILDDLVQRNMVQVLERFGDGSIQYIRLHDVLSELAVRKAQEFNFLMVCSKPDIWENCRKAPRVTIHYSSSLNVPFGNYTSLNVYSLLIFFEWSDSNTSGQAINVDCSKLRSLRVLRCNGWRNRVKLQSFEGVPHLRHLQLWGADIYGKESEFEEWIRGMEYLETLALQFSSHGRYLSDCMWLAKTQLRHVLVHQLKGPPASIDLKNLQTLKGVEWNDQWETSSFPNIPNVRKLGISIPENVPAIVVASLIGRLKYVVDLSISGNAINLQEIATATEGCPFNENLKYLCVNNTNDIRRDGGTLALPLDLCDGMLTPHLIELRIYGHQFGSDIMPVLEKLGSLKVLSLNGAFG